MKQLLRAQINNNRVSKNINNPGFLFFLMTDNNTKKETRYEIQYDREGCIGAAACAAVCPENWFMEADNKADFKKKDLAEGEEYEKNLQAAQVCPVNVIHIIDKKTGKKII